VVELNALRSYLEESGVRAYVGTNVIYTGICWSAGKFDVVSYTHRVYFRRGCFDVRHILGYQIMTVMLCDPGSFASVLRVLRSDDLPFGESDCFAVDGGPEFPGSCDSVER
jgi:hypothetical protein